MPLPFCSNSALVRFASPALPVPCAADNRGVLEQGLIEEAEATEERDHVSGGIACTPPPRPLYAASWRFPAWLSPAVARPIFSAS